MDHHRHYDDNRNAPRGSLVVVREPCFGSVLSDVTVKKGP